MSSNSKNFKSYFAGLLESTGSFFVESKIGNSNNYQHNGKIKVEFVKKDKPLAEILKSYYGGEFEEHTNSIVWSITNPKQVLSICNDINGYLRTPKINDFYKLVKFIKIQNRSIKFKILPMDETSINSNAWLAGFSDGNSNFNLNISKKKNNKTRVQIQFRIEIKQFYDRTLIKNSENFSNFVPICNTIAESFDLGIYHRTRKKKYHLIIIVSTSFHTNNKIINYFEKFPLFSSKYLDYKNWKAIHNMQKKNCI